MGGQTFLTLYKAYMTEIAFIRTRVQADYLGHDDADADLLDISHDDDSKLFYQVSGTPIRLLTNSKVGSGSIGIIGLSIFASERHSLHTVIRLKFARMKET